jgi:hypothetical protein
MLGSSEETDNEFCRSVAMLGTIRSWVMLIVTVLMALGQ